MKYICFPLLIIVLSTAGIASCKKTNASKFSNEWQVTSFEEKKSGNYYDGSKSNESTSVSGNSITMAYDFKSGNSNQSGSINGVVNSFEYIISKDGNWSSIMDYTLISNSTSSTRFLKEESGTWSFVSKNDTESFKKNEKVIFNILSQGIHSTQTNNGINVGENNESNTYLTGEKVVLYTVVESKNKKLQLKYENKVVYTESSGTSSTYMTGDLNLEQQ